MLCVPQWQSSRFPVLQFVCGDGIACLGELSEWSTQDKQEICKYIICYGDFLDVYIKSFTFKFQGLREGKSNFQWFQVRREKNANVNLESCSQILEETRIFKDLLRTDKMWKTELTRVHITIFHWNIIFLSIVITIQSHAIKIRIIILQNKSRVLYLVWLFI